VQYLLKDVHKPEQTTELCVPYFFPFSTLLCPDHWGGGGGTKSVFYVLVVSNKPVANFYVGDEFQLTYLFVFIALHSFLAT
jgi:hypothetical protein